MKKLFSALVLVSFLGILLFPVAVSGQDTPKDCCILNRAITFKGVTCNKDYAVGPTTAVVGSGGDCVGKTFCANPAGTGNNDHWGMYCILNTLYGVTDWIFVALVAVAGIMVVLGALNILTAGGSPDKVTSGRNYVIYAAVGLAVGLLARAIPAIVKMIVG